MDESYQLAITPKQIILDAPTTIGALRGLETFLQLVQSIRGQYSLPLVRIEDKPRFAWRGLMIDVARHFIPLPVIKRNIDAMAVVKMNVLHLHLSDDEGFRVESRLFPALQQKGSYGEYYTQSQIRELVGYAAQRGVMIVPEFDMPGHSRALLAAYPQLASAPGTYEPGPRFQRDEKMNEKLQGKPIGLAEIMTLMNTTPTPTIDPSRESTYHFLDQFLGEMANLFPGPYLHIGADENNGVAWKANPAIVAFMQQQHLADTHALQAYFVSRLQRILTKHHKRTLGWEEVLTKDLPKDVLVQVWSDSTYLSRALQHGNAVIVSKGLYLDLFLPAYVHYNSSLLSSPFADSVSAQLLGGEAAQWTEVVDQDNIETRVWPRAAAIAERLWSPAAVKDVDDLYRRLFVISDQLDELGVQHIGNYERSLRRLTHGEAIAPLQTLTDILTPIKGYKKAFAKLKLSASHLYQTAPMNRVSDLVFVDSQVKRSFRAAVKQYLTNRDQTALQFIRHQLSYWQTNGAALDSLLARQPMEKAVNQHAQNLHAASLIGLEALKWLETNQPPPVDWTTQKLAVLDTFKTAYGEVELAILPELEALVQQRLSAEPVVYSLY